MSFTGWYNGLVKKMKWYDIGLTKLASMAFILLVAKFYPQILNADWTVYLGIFVVTAAIVGYHIFKK